MPYIECVCGRFCITTDPATLAQHFELPSLAAELHPRFNVAPNQLVPVIRLTSARRRRLDLVVWGLIPSWAKDRNIGHRMINARAETLASRPAFRDAYRRRHCLVVADGFYEWAKTSRGRQPFLIRLKGGGPLAFAGLWERWRSETGATVDSCTIITTEANDAVKPIHDRMPVIVDPQTYERWLDPRSSQSSPPLDTLLCPAASGLLESMAVGRRVNNPRNDDPGCIEPAPDRGNGAEPMARS